MFVFSITETTMNSDYYNIHAYIGFITTDESKESSGFMNILNRFYFGFVLIFAVKKFLQHLIPYS